MSTATASESPTENLSASLTQALARFAIVRRRRALVFLGIIMLADALLNRVDFLYRVVQTAGAAADPVVWVGIIWIAFAIKGRNQLIVMLAAWGLAYHTMANEMSNMNPLSLGSPWFGVLLWNRLFMCVFWGIVVQLLTLVFRPAPKIVAHMLPREGS